jgi:hypothetical protein
MSYARGVRVRVLRPVLGVFAVVASFPACALASSNAGATQAYLQADYALVRVARTHLATSEAAPLQILAQVRRECPGAGAGSPQNPESTQVSDEVIGAMVISAAKPDRAAIDAFIHATSGLSWSNSALTRAVHTYGSDMKTVLNLPVPNLCAEVKAWAADGYKSLPTSTVSFVAKFMPAWVAVGLLPPQLAHYESASDKTLVAHATPLEQQLTEGEARAVEHWGEIMDTLQLWP